MRRRRFTTVLVVALGAMLALPACTGVPSSSAPQTIKNLPLGGETGQAPILPQVGALPRDLVTAFLAANAAEAGSHTATRAFLTPAARNRWLDSTATIVDGETVGTYRPGRPVVVQARVLGTLNANGIYTPSLQGTGDGGPAVPFEFGVKKINGQYRIDTLRNGLVLTVDQFRQVYQPRMLYFFDGAGRYLVPDPRWSAITDPGLLANWLVTQLAEGPRPELQNAVNSDTLPNQASTRRLGVDLNSPVKIEIPGSAQLDPGARNRLAEQLARTLAQAVSADDVLEITDGGTPVHVPAAGSTQFTASGFSEQGTPTAPSPTVYYLRGNRVVDQAGTPLPGAVNRTVQPLSSIALTRGPGPENLDIAAVSGAGTAARLLVGTQDGGLRPTPVRGRLTRPSWAPATPGGREVWIGDGSRIYRVTITDRSVVSAVVPVPSTAAGGRIVALRLSPEGSRLAVVIAAANGAQQLFLGTIVRGGGQARVDTLQQISPQGVVVTDVAWIESTNLFAIGYDASSLDARVYEVGVDGSAWTARGLGGLPGPPDSLTVAPRQLAWVSVTDSVWRQQGSTWESPGLTGQTAGTMPVYLE